MPRAPFDGPTRSSFPRRAACASPLLALAACSSDSPSVLDPHGPAAREVTRLWWPMLWASAIVFVFVVAMAGWALVRGRRRAEHEIQRDVRWGDRFILVSGLGVTALILVGFFVFSAGSMSRLARAGRSTSLSITVIGHDWWWEARYPNGGVTANEIHIPVGQRVHLTLLSADVIHSLWVPQLAPKIDLIPGRTNGMWIQADQAGRYRGQCAEYCGLQHAHMIFFVVAEEPAAFRRWMTDIGAPALSPIDDLTKRGRDVFMSNTCVGCHAIRGTEADGRLGPDLTHMATRSTIAAGTLPLTAETLRRWIVDPQAIKPNVTMPPTGLSDEDARALVAYLMSLGFRGGT